MDKQVQLNPSRKCGRFRKELPFHLMLLVPVILVFIYMYLPMGGLVIAFRPRGFSATRSGSAWATSSCC